MAQGTRAGAFVAVLFKGTRVGPGGPRGMVSQGGIWEVVDVEPTRLTGL